MCGEQAFSLGGEMTAPAHSGDCNVNSKFSSANVHDDEFFMNLVVRDSYA